MAGWLTGVERNNLELTVKQLLYSGVGSQPLYSNLSQDLNVIPLCALSLKVPCLGEGNNPNFSNDVYLESALMGAPWSLMDSA